jgi:hypothetical protein
MTWRLVSDVWRRPRSATPAGHDIASQGLHLDLPKALPAVKQGFGAEMWRRTAAGLRT